MEINWTIIEWIGAIIVFYLIGIFEGRRAGYKKRKVEEAREGNGNPPPTPLPATTNVDDPGILRIKNENGALTLDLDGARVNPLLLTADHRKRMMELLVLIRPWLDGQPAPAHATTPQSPLSQPMPVPVPPAATPPQPTIPLRSPAPKDKKSAQENRPTPPPTSIVGQIDFILQEKLIGSPLSSKSLSLSQSPEGGVIVNVGASQYFDVNEVPDAEIKSAIRAAIAEWEKKYTPGL